MCRLMVAGCLHVQCSITSRLHVLHKANRYIAEGFLSVLEPVCSLYRVQGQSSFSQSMHLQPDTVMFAVSGVVW
jgi:hypothetical protein